MKKAMNYPKERMKLNIELADNGIIIRDPECEDGVTLAVTERYGTDYKPDLKNEYWAIGERIYDWLLNVVIQKHDTELTITNFDIDITATCKGRDFV